MSARPERDSDQLRAAADFLDLADNAFALLARLLDRPNPITGDEIQQDLRRIAQRLDELDGFKGMTNDA